MELEGSVIPDLREEKICFCDNCVFRVAPYFEGPLHVVDIPCCCSDFSSKARVSE